MRIVFVNAFKTWNPANWIVALWTSFKERQWGVYNHCEFVFDDNRMFGASFTKGKCRWDKYDPTKREYDVIQIDAKSGLIRLDCDYYNNKHYDYMGLLGFIPNTDEFQDKDKFFCSELIVSILEKRTPYKFSKEACRVSPNRLYRDLKK